MRTAILSALLAVCPVWGASPQTETGRPKKTDPPVIQSSLGETDPAKMAAPATPAGAGTPGAAPVDYKTYVIGAEDVLNIQVWGHAPLSGTVTVRPDGLITLGPIHEVRAAGLTPERLTNDLTARLKDGGFVQPARVSVAVQQVNSKKACIVGEVLKPGCFNLVVPTTVLEALVNTGGFKDFANRKNIAIQRGEQRFTFNYKRVIAGKNREQNIPLEPGDIIIVK